MADGRVAYWQKDKAYRAANPDYFQCQDNISGQNLAIHGSCVITTLEYWKEYYRNLPAMRQHFRQEKYAKAKATLGVATQRAVANTALFLTGRIDVFLLPFINFIEK